MDPAETRWSWRSGRRGGGVLFACLVAALACAAPPESGSAPMNGSTPPRTDVSAHADRGPGWEPLFDGTSLAAWRGYRRDEVPDGWAIRDGTLARVGPGGDLITRETFGDFELTLEWKVEEGGNSGVFFRATEEPEAIYEVAPEVQILDDDGHPDGGDPLTSAGSNYALHPAPRDVVRPPGEWNEIRLRVQGDHVEHWLNGRKIVDYQLWSDDWSSRVAASKFAAWPGYGRSEAGHIGLQDHGDPVWFRNIRIRRLDGDVR